ncbi:MAG: M20/M25/M40 family metallo-hydrolase [Oscillospiraceae bacterium]|nr:M20/M25/M40 family metallo-hydrolase [Oscillospiraceae bacterium]
MINKERLLNTFLDYVRIDSESRDEAAMARRLTDDLTTIGCQIYVDNTMDKTGSNTGNIYATLPGNAPGEPVVLSAHLDTVVPGVGVEPVLEGGIIRSKGDTVLGSDDKSGVVAIVEAMRVVTEQNIPHPTVQAVFTVCEEVGLCGSKYLEYDKLVGGQAVALDTGTPGVIVTSGPGQYKIEATVVGRKAHAGVAPEQGVSAIQVLAEAISNMKLLRIDPETTANIGSIHADYPTNIVAERATMSAECRSRDAAKLEEQAEHMEACLRAACEKYGATLEIERTKAYDAFKHQEDAPVIRRVAAAMTAAGLTPTLKPSGGGSDANNMCQNGIEAVVVGTGMDKVHTTSEQIAVADLESTAAMVLELIKA